MYRRFIFLAFPFFTLYQAQCQDNFSEAFFYSPKNIQVYVPALAGLENRVQANLVYKTYVGKLSVIRAQYADLNVHLEKAKEGARASSQHVVGGGLYADKEGDFFSKTRALFRYALHLPLREDLTLSGGAALHLINYHFSASGAGASGSAWTWSGNIAAALSSPTFKLGASFNDFNSPELRPIGYAFILRPYTTFYAEKLLRIASETYVRGGGRYNVLWQNGSSVLVQFGVLFSRDIGLTSFYYLHKGWGGAVEINKIKLNKEHYIDLSLAYQVPTQNQVPPASQYEINLQYYLKK